MMPDPDNDTERFSAERRTPIAEPSRRSTRSSTRSSARSSARSRANNSGGPQFRDLLLGLLVLTLISGGAWYLINMRDEVSLPPGFGLGGGGTRLASVPADASGLSASPPPAQASDGTLAPVAQPPALDGSDAQVDEALLDLAPALLQWLTPDEQIRKWVLLVVNLADGNVVNKHRPLRYPMKRFATRERGGTLTMDPVNFERAGPLLDATLAIPPQKLAAYYRQWSPVLSRSFAELGRDGTFHGHFVVVLDNITAAGEPVSAAALEQPHVLFQYVEPTLEEASALHKLLWRLGPQRMAAVQRYAAALKASL